MEPRGEQITDDAQETYALVPEKQDGFEIGVEKSVDKQIEEAQPVNEEKFSELMEGVIGGLKAKEDEIAKNGQRSLKEGAESIGIPPEGMVKIMQTMAETQQTMAIMLLEATKRMSEVSGRQEVKGESGVTGNNEQKQQIPAEVAEPQPVEPDEIFKDEEIQKAVEDLSKPEVPKAMFFKDAVKEYNDLLLVENPSEEQKKRLKDLEGSEDISELSEPVAIAEGAPDELKAEDIDVELAEEIPPEATPVLKSEKDVSWAEWALGKMVNAPKKGSWEDSVQKGLEKAGDATLEFLGNDISKTWEDAKWAAKKLGAGFRWMFGDKVTDEFVGAGEAFKETAEHFKIISPEDLDPDEREAGEMTALVEINDNLEAEISKIEASNLPDGDKDKLTQPLRTAVRGVELATEQKVAGEPEWEKTLKAVEEKLKRSDVDRQKMVAQYKKQTAGRKEAADSRQMHDDLATATLLMAMAGGAK